jgi:hypothetical protein
MDKKTNRLLTDLGTLGWEPGLTPESYEHIAGAGFRGESAVNAAIICDLAAKFEPITLRGLFYQCVSVGLFPSTDDKHYNAVKRLTGQLRLKGIMPFEWLVDSLRTTDKPSSWSGLNDFADTVRNAYRKDFWSHLDWYVHIICEKDAIAGTLQPVTREYDVALSPIRGNTSHSFAHALGSQFARIQKPIFVGYLGDFDPNGMDIERDLKAKLVDHSGRAINDLDLETPGEMRIVWQRLAVSGDDIEKFNLMPLSPKKSDSRYRKFIEEHGNQAVEVDALPPDELRKRVRKSIEQFVPQEEWNRLKEVEQFERETFNQALNLVGTETSQ